MHSISKTLYVSSFATAAVIFAAVFPFWCPKCEFGKQVLWTMAIVLPPIWLLVEWNYVFSDADKHEEQRRAARV